MNKPDVNFARNKLLHGNWGLHSSLFLLVYWICVLLIELFSFCLERNNVCTLYKRFSFLPLTYLLLISSKNITFSSSLYKVRRHKASWKASRCTESRPEGLLYKLVSAKTIFNVRESEREMERRHWMMGRFLICYVLILQFHIVHQFSLVPEYFFPFCRTQNILLKKIRKALKIKRNIHNKLPLTRLLLPNVFWGKKKKKLSSKENQERFFFCVHNLNGNFFLCLKISLKSMDMILLWGLIWRVIEVRSKGGWFTFADDELVNWNFVGISCCFKLQLGFQPEIHMTLNCKIMICWLRYH